MHRIFIYLTFPFLLFAILSCGKKNNTVKDYLNTGKSISFNNEIFNLAWSSHPSDNYYKQEYLREKDTLEKFNKIILFDVVTGPTPIEEVVASKVKELQKMKESDPMINYDVFEKNDEVMIDFLLSKNIPGREEQNIVERNVYRYKTIKDKNGKDGVLLFGVSERAYGDDIEKFLLFLKDKRFDIPNLASTFVIPEITIKN